MIEGRGMGERNDRRERDGRERNERRERDWREE